MPYQMCRKDPDSPSTRLPRQPRILKTPIRDSRGLGGCLLLSLAPLVLSCCTYSFSGLASQIRSVAVPVFGNKTTRYGIEEVLTRKVIDAFVADNRLRVVERGKAASLLLGEVVSFSREPFSYDEKEQVREYRVLISAEVTYQSLPEEELVWEARIDEWGTYSAVGGTEEQAVEEAAAKFAEEVIRRTLEQW